MDLRRLVGWCALLVCLASCGSGEAGSDAVIRCDGGDLLCGQSCVDASADPRHCGGCDQACAPDRLCVEGACGTCAEGLDECSGGCADLTSSVAHCGACGTSCAEGEICTAGSCEIPCPDGQRACDGTCHAPTTSALHCGGCGNACAPGELCAEGACAIACPGEQTACDGGCHTLETSIDHCGACGNVCGAGAVCSDGACRPAVCPEQHEICGDACIDTGSDAANCGGCGLACSRGERCSEGSCAVACAEDQVLCDGTCRNLDRDAAHCGACGASCDAGELCDGGTCAPHCGTFAQEICDGACTNLAVDPANCGSCGDSCGAGEHCARGACVAACPPDAAACGGSCTDLLNDPANCGSCGNACPSMPNGVAICTAGQCGGICASGYGDCNGDLTSAAGDGCETRVDADLENCGACGKVCPIPPGGAPFCGGGSCGYACALDRGDCNFDDSDGCETHLSTSTDCGSCGNQCLGASYCDAGNCVLPGPGADCANAIALSTGSNTITWSATRQTYLQNSPVCIAGNSAPVGPDIVLRFDPTLAGEVTLDFVLPASANWNVVAVRDGCGAIDAPLACATLSVPRIGLPNSRITFNTVLGSSYYLHLVNTSGTGSLAQPLQVTVAERAVGCAPGIGGMVGAGQTRLFSGVLGMVYEHFVAADDAPGGWVYFGGASSLHRIPKAGGLTQDVAAAAGPGFQLGHEMLIDGQNLYVTASGSQPRLQRISTDGGATFSVQDALAFPGAPAGELRAAAAHGGRIFAMSFEYSTTSDTRIWSASSTVGPTPATAVLEHTIPGSTHSHCGALAVDANNFYVFCGSGSMRTDAVVLRIDRTSGATTSLFTEPSTSSFGQPRQKLSLHAHDVDADGTADFLYFLDDTPSAGFICNPAGATPLASRPYFFGTGTGNFGLGFDRAANALWGFLDDTNELVKFQ